MIGKKSVRILYMEDDSGAARLFSKRLQKIGYAVETVGNGKEGLEKFVSGEFDIVFVDAVMPIMGGVEVIRVASARGYATPIVMLTGTGDERTAVEAIKLGARDYIIKDVDGCYLDLLPSVIEKVLQQHRLTEENKRALEELRESEERFRGIIETTHDYYWVLRIDAAGDFSKAVMLACSKGLGVPPDESMENLEVGCARPYHPDWSWKNLEEACLKVFATGEVISNVQSARLDLSKNATEYFSSEIFPFKKGGAIIGVQGLSEEITQRRKAEEKVRLYSEELKRSNADLERFAFVASHDLQEPLRKVVAFCDLISNEYSSVLDETGRDYLRRISQSTVRMRDLVDDLLQYSRVGARTKCLGQIDLGKPIAEALSNLEVRIAQSGGKVVVEKETDDPPPTIEADRFQMVRLFQNLVGNALKFHRTGVPPVVRVTVKKDGEREGFVKIKIEDNGIGFDEKYVSRIFAPFERLNPKSQFEGTGLGLAICHKIVRSHGGSIAAEGRPNEGATFTVVLPEKQAETGPA
ncbi:MAG: response regulator [Nitrospinae bacterium]|nr:response regulator [Nitrospinota bacterium]